MTDLVSIGFKADASGIKQAGNELDKLSKKGAGTDASVNKLDKSVNQLNKDFGVLDKSVAKNSKTQAAANANMSKFGRSSGQAGIQLQQFIGQVQGGQSAMLALSQQSADLGFVLGAPLLGAIVGIGASLAGMLIPSLIGASADVDELTDRIEGLGESAIKTVNQIRFLANENSKAADELSKDNEKIAKSIIAKQKELDKLVSAGVGTDTSQFAIPRTAAQNQERYADTIKETKQELAALRATLDTNNQEIIKLSENTQELSKVEDKFADKTASAVEYLQRQAIALEYGEKAAVRFGIAQSLGLASIKELPPEIQKLLDKIDELNAKSQADSFFEKTNSLLTMQQANLSMTSKEFAAYKIRMEGVAAGAAPDLIEKLIELSNANEDLKASIKDDKALVSQEKALNGLIDQVDNFSNSWSSAADTIAQAMGDIVGGLDSYSAKMEKITGLEKSLKSERELSTATAEDKLRIDQALADLEDQSTRAQLSGMAQISGAAASLFAEQSKEREALHKMEQVYTAIEIGLALQKAGANALTAITSSFAAPFPVNFAAGAAMIGIMAGLGVFSGSGGGSAPSSAELQASQGTGTVMGGADEKSESIINALEEYNDIGIDQLAQLVGIRNAMSNLASGIENLAVSLVTSSSFGGADVEGLGTTKAYSGNVMNAFFGGERLIDKMLGGTINSLVDGIFGNFKKTTKKLLDTGIAFDAQTIGDLIANGVLDASYYNVIETTKRSFWGLIKKTGQTTEFTDIETAISDEFVAIFGFLGNTVTSAIQSLGVDAAASLESFDIDLPNLSFKDMSGEEIQKELEAIFSQQGDLIAEYMLPQITEYQNMGEGALETLTRVAKEQAYFNDAVDALGLSLGDLSNLMRIDVAQAVLDLMGGLEAFSSATSSYIENFFSDSEKMDMLGSSLSDVFDGLGVPMVTTTDGFKDLVAGIDLTTLAGQEMFATLMAINPAMAEYIEMLDDQEEAIDKSIEKIKDLASDAYDDLVLAVEAEKDRVAAALQGAKDIYAAEIERITGVRDTLNETFDALTGNLDDAKSAMVDAFDAQKQQILDASTMRIEGIQQEIDASRTYHEIELDFLSDRKSALNDMISGLSGASGNLRSIAEVDTAALSTDLAAALSAAQGGNFNPAMALGDISALMGDASGFSSAAQMNVSRGVTGFAANELANLVDNQLSVEERTLALLEQQTINETARYDAEQAMLAERIEKENDTAEMQIAALDAQLNNLLGINTGVLSVDASIIAFQKAQDELNSLDYERQLEMLAEQEEWAMEALDVAEQNSQDQIDKLDGILNNATNQINALYNINTSVLSVQEAIFQLQTTITNAEAAQANRDAQIAKQTRKTADGIQQINAVGVQTEAIA